MRDLQYEEHFRPLGETCAGSHGGWRAPERDEPSPPHPLFKGLCDGGPKHGQQLTSLFRRVTIPIVYRGQNGIGAGCYLFKPENQTWIWRGA
jgi:hypothetical protein